MKTFGLSQRAAWGHMEEYLDPEKDLYWFMSNIQERDLGLLKAWCRFFISKAVPFTVLKQAEFSSKLNKRKYSYFLLKNRVVDEDGLLIKR